MYVKHLFRISDSVLLNKFKHLFRISDSVLLNKFIIYTVTVNEKCGRNRILYPLALYFSLKYLFLYPGISGFDGYRKVLQYLS